jgi:hypothetical protein
VAFAELNMDEGSKLSNADTLAAIGNERAELWHTPVGVAYATIEVEGHQETHGIESRGFRDYLTREFWRESGRAVSPDALRQALALLAARARFDGEEHDVHLRVAPLGGGGLVLDLGDAEGRVVVADGHGWQIVPRSPVRFRRAPGMLALPEPEPGGSLEELAVLLPGGRDGRDDLLALLLGWLLASLRPSGPYPVLVIQGEHGSLKSTTAKKLRQLVDPSESDLRAPPRNTHDLAIAAENARVLAYDNLSAMPQHLSDHLCRLATGGGFSTRRLYTDDSDRIFNATRPIILNGIDAVVTRGDLIDRAIEVTLPRFTHYRPEAEVWADFNAAKPRTLGALLDAVVYAVSNESSTTVPPRMRMADAARWVAAAEPKLPVAPGTFLAAYAGVRQEGHRATIDGSAIGAALLTLLDKEGEWSGTSSELLDTFATLADDRAVRSKEWPSSPRSLSAEIRRLAPALRALGGEAEQPRRRVWVLKGPQGGADDRQDRHDRHADDGGQPARDGHDGYDGQMHSSEGQSSPRRDAPGADDVPPPGAEPW